MQALAASCEELRARTGKPPLGFRVYGRAKINAKFGQNIKVSEKF
jgi:hypothetical protein